MIDPLAQIVGLLQPSATVAKAVSAAGPWAVRRADAGQPFYAAVTEGTCLLTVERGEPTVLQAGDFVLIPAARGFVMSSLQPPPRRQPEMAPVALRDGSLRHGDPRARADVRLLVGHCQFGSADEALLVSLLPELVHVRGDARLAALVQLVAEEARARRPAREVVLARLVEVLFIEALRTTGHGAAPPGLLRGLADPRLAAAIRRMHAQPSRAWTVDQLAKEAALSRSTFFERFNREVGAAPMAYLQAWRMALAKKLLRDRAAAVAEVAQRVGYSSASTFSVAFARHVGVPPARYARAVNPSARQSA